MHDSGGSAAVQALPRPAGSVRLLRFTRSYPGRQDQVSQVRAFLRETLSGRPRADDAVAVGSEFAANACLHSRSGVPGGVFTVQAEVSEGDYLYVAVQDDGGGGEPLAAGLTPGHGLDLVQAIAGPGNWGIGAVAAGHLVWARLPWPLTTETDHSQAAGMLDGSQLPIEEGTFSGSPSGRGAT